MAKAKTRKSSAARKAAKPSKSAGKSSRGSKPARKIGRTSVSTVSVKKSVKMPKNAKPTKVKKEASPVINNPPLPPAPVTTDGKPKKNQAGMHVRELEHFRDMLLAKRRELVGDMSSMEREALRTSGGTNLSNLPLHMADMGTDNYEQEFTLGLMEKDRNLLRDINTALAKLQNGTYGICEGTGKPISKARLEAQPWARYSIEHARKMEKGPIRQIGGE